MPEAKPDHTVELYGIKAEVPESTLLTWDDNYKMWILTIYKGGGQTMRRNAFDNPGTTHLFACAAEHEWFSKYSPICKPEDWDRETRTHEQAEAWHRIAEAAKDAMEKEMDDGDTSR